LKRDGFAATLTSTLQTSYERISVVDVESGVRLTADSGVKCRAVVGKEALIEGVVIETKSPRGPGPIDRALWRRGVLFASANMQRAWLQFITNCRAISGTRPLTDTSVIEPF